MKQKLLTELLAPWIDNPGAMPACLISGVAADSRLVQPGDLFLALTPAYIEEALSKGAAAIISEHPSPQTRQLNVPYYLLPELRAKLGPIAARFYDYPSQDMRIIGVTGTNGKSSCTHFIAQAVKMAGLSSAVIGTLGNGCIDQLSSSAYTTPDAVALQKLLNDFRQQHIRIVAMETSSHGLAQKRTLGTTFYAGAFTNLTRDHLDYHGNLENYADAKFQLFKQDGLQYAILNIDDPYGQRWAEQLKTHLPVYAISTAPDSASADKFPLIHATSIQPQANGLATALRTPWGEGVLHTPLWGAFNISNLLIVTAVLGSSGFPLADILHYLSRIKSIPGRMQILGGNNNKPRIVIDYAHTPDALAKALQALREHCQGQIWCVFGCGGDRDRGKRPQMGAIAEHYADQLILTNDNPRTENPAQILAEIHAGIARQDGVAVEPDRRRAIAHAVQCAKSDDVILIAGKGHENYQIIGKEKYPFSDFLEAKMQLFGE